MPDMILRILSILGLGILCLGGAALLMLLLVLFWPAFYRVKAEKHADCVTAQARADWFFGIFRVRFAYPKPGHLTVKLLWKTLIDTGRPKEASPQNGHKADNDAAQKTDPAKTQGAEEAGRTAAQPQDAQNIGAGTAQLQDTGTRESTAQAGAQPQAAEENAAPRAFFFGISEKIQKIQYTILQIYDKIKEIWENISYYSALLRDEETAQLWAHVKLRAGKIWRDVRPRRIRADILFGTGSPDTTGYAFGLYGMLSPALGKGVCVTPDFERAVLEGSVDLSGHVTLWILLWHAGTLLVDKKLERFRRRLVKRKHAAGTAHEPRGEQGKATPA